MCWYVSVDDRSRSHVPTAEDGAAAGLVWALACHVTAEQRRRRGCGGGVAAAMRRLRRALPQVDSLLSHFLDRYFPESKTGVRQVSPCSLLSPNTLLLRQPLSRLHSGSVPKDHQMSISSPSLPPYMHASIHPCKQPDLPRPTLTTGGPRRQCKTCSFRRGSSNAADEPRCLLPCALPSRRTANDTAAQTSCTARVGGGLRVVSGGGENGGRRWGTEGGRGEGRADARSARFR